MQILGGITSFVPPDWTNHNRFSNLEQIERKSTRPYHPSTAIPFPSTFPTVKKERRDHRKLHKYLKRVRRQESGGPSNILGMKYESKSGSRVTLLSLGGVTLILRPSISQLAQFPPYIECHRRLYKSAPRLRASVLVSNNTAARATHSIYLASFPPLLSAVAPASSHEVNNKGYSISHNSSRKIKMAVVFLPTRDEAI